MPNNWQSLVNSDPKIQDLFCKLQSSATIAVMVIVALQIARLLAVKFVEDELQERAFEPT